MHKEDVDPQHLLDPGKVTLVSDRVTGHKVARRRDPRSVGDEASAPQLILASRLGHGDCGVATDRCDRSVRHRRLTALRTDLFTRPRSEADVRQHFEKAGES